MSERIVMTKYVVAFGNPFDGITLEGPFDTADEATGYAERSSDDFGDWNVVEVAEPEKR